MGKLLEEITSFKTGEPFAAGTGEGSIPFLKLIPKEKKKVLVIGCGEGQEVDWLVKQGFAAIGLTNNKEEAENGQKNSASK